MGIPGKRERLEAWNRRNADGTKLCYMLVLDDETQLPILMLGVDRDWGRVDEGGDSLTSAIDQAAPHHEIIQQIDSDLTSAGFESHSEREARRDRALNG